MTAGLSMADLHSVAVNVYRVLQRRATYLQTVIVAGLGMGGGFGLNWSGEQIALVTTFSAAVLALLFDPPQRRSEPDPET